MRWIGFSKSFLRPDWVGMTDPQALAMPMDIYETADNIVVKTAVPGVKPEDIEVTITGDLLSDQGRDEDEREGREGKLPAPGAPLSGSFCRQVNLPVAVETERVQATF